MRQRLKVVLLVNYAGRPRCRILSWGFEPGLEMIGLVVVFGWSRHKVLWNWSVILLIEVRLVEIFGRFRSPRPVGALEWNIFF